MFRIEHIEYLGGLAAIPLLVATLYFLLSWKKKTAGRIGDPALVSQLIRNFSSWRFLLKAGLAIVAFMVIVLGAANPQKPGSMQNVQRKGVDVMFVLDVSKSMLARDIKPSRLDKAKQLMLQLVDKLENDRIGIVLFAGRPYMQMPLTTDHGAAKMYIQDASPDAVPTQGTVIGEALQMANSAFDARERKFKTIVLISDGEDHDPEAAKIAKRLAQDGVIINTIGIGTPDGSPIVDPATGELKKDDQGNVVMSKLNEAELQNLSNITNGQYIRLDNVDDALITMTQQPDNAEKKSVTDAELIDYKSFFQWFMAAALLLLVIEYLLSERRKETPARPVAAPILLFILACAALPVSTQAQSANAHIRSGNRYYKKNQLDRSIEQYQSAVQQTPNNPTANYNLGNAEFKKKQFDAASRSYDATIQNSPDDKMKENGYYNKGVAMIKQQKLQESIDAWKKALKLDASDADARDNLERALRQLKQQQQQQQNQQKKDQNDQKKKDQKKNQDQQQQQQQQPKPLPSKLNKQEVEQLLKALEQKENDLHNKMQQNKMHTPNQPDKDW